MFDLLVLSGPVPEKPIDISDCRDNLLNEIETGFNTLEARINLFEAKTNGRFSLFKVTRCLSCNSSPTTFFIVLQDLKI